MARKSNKVIQAEGALANLVCVLELAIEARDLGEVHGDNKAFIHHAHDVRRWVTTVLAGGLTVPAGVERYATFWRGR